VPPGSTDEALTRPARLSWQEQTANLAVKITCDRLMQQTPAARLRPATAAADPLSDQTELRTEVLAVGLRRRRSSGLCQRSP
jgi:hypothetical protein